MNSRLDRIQDWESRVTSAGYCAAALAREVAVSERNLRRFIRERFGIGLHEWLVSKRMKRAVEMLRAGRQVKEVADALGFARTSSFDTTFRQWSGLSPREFVSGGVQARWGAVESRKEARLRFAKPPKTRIHCADFRLPPTLDFG